MAVVGGGDGEEEQKRKSDKWMRLL